MRYTGGSSVCDSSRFALIDPVGNTTTAPAGGGAPSAGRGNNADKGEETIVMLRDISSSRRLVACWCGCGRS